ncbi:hypothetical protein [Lysobacter auxotrophicus]|uniref:DUF5666 domain-containing protein n=1 Tax=Lysobacter auxotrophicus TaxID=2992573 RepID=A0ABN6UKW9_9GAMM|nr:hypothetical protein [Lysobacter auxotrophicus]BDU16954.1 hypothetical protein LA521A_21550 [Lysobacter auxotrophicus]
MGKATSVWIHRAWLACALLGVLSPALAQVQGRTVGTLQRHDPAQHRIVLSLDARTGSELGQGAPVNLYYDEAKAARDRATRPKLQPGDRVMLDTVKTGNRVEATSVVRLPDTTPGQGWGQYLHGTVGEFVPRTNVLMVDQAETRIRNRIGVDAGTQVFALDGTPMRREQLKPGDEIDMAFHLKGRVRTASKIVLLRPAGG